MDVASGSNLGDMRRSAHDNVESFVEFSPGARACVVMTKRGWACWNEDLRGCDVAWGMWVVLGVSWRHQPS